MARKMILDCDTGTDDAVAIMLAAPKVGRPVKWVEDRRENLLAAGKSRQEHARVPQHFTEFRAGFIAMPADCIVIACLAR